MNIKALAIASAIALTSPIAAQAITISGGDSLENPIVHGAGNYNSLDQRFASMIVMGSPSDSAGSVQFDFELLIDSNQGTLSVALLPDGDQFPGVKDLVIETRLNGVMISNDTFTNSAGVATPLYDALQDQVALSLNADSGDVLSIIASYSGFGTQNSIFNIGVEVQPVPLPAAGLMFLTALGGLGFVSRRRKAA